MSADYENRGAEIGQLVAEKQRQYGDSVAKSGGIMRILYPAGVRPDQMDDALLVVRVLDKLSRISQRGADGQDLGGESPWRDIAGYGLLGWRKDDGCAAEGDAPGSPEIVFTWSRGEFKSGQVFGGLAVYPSLKAVEDAVGHAAGPLGMYFWRARRLDGDQVEILGRVGG